MVPARPVLAALLALGLAGSGAAQGVDAAIPYRIEGPSSGSGIAGFFQATLAELTLGRIEDPRSGDFELVLLPARTRVELVDPLADGEAEVRTVLADGRTVWLPPFVLAGQDGALTLPPDQLRSRARDKQYRPVKSLPAGIDYRWLYRAGARLHLVIADLRANPDLEFFPWSTSRYNGAVEGDEQLVSVTELARRAGAQVALNGTFFIMDGPEKGKPLGALISKGRVLFDLEDPYVLSRNRSYLAMTNAGRFVMGETDVPGARLLELNRIDAFDREVLAEGERVVSLIGGLGRLAEAGNPDAWREHAGIQFAEKYYSGYIRRPQSVIGLADEGRRLMLLVQEGAPHSQRCLSLPELGHVMVGLGAEDVAFGDGGGSSDLIVMGRKVVRTEHRGRERPNSTILVLKERRIARSTASALAYRAP